MQWNSTRDHITGWKPIPHSKPTPPGKFTMQIIIRSLALVTVAFACLSLAPSCDAASPEPPEGYRAIFNGNDLSGWYGWNPHASAKLAGEKKAANLREQRAEFPQHWSVENGELVNDGHGPYATTEQEFGNIDLLIEYKTVPSADSGVYLRGSPQVQICVQSKETRSQTASRIGGAVQQYAGHSWA